MAARGERLYFRRGCGLDGAYEIGGDAGRLGELMPVFVWALRGRVQAR